MSDTVWPQFYHDYYSDDTYPYRYFTVSPVSGSYADNADISIQYTMQYYSSWSGGKIENVNFVELYYYNSTGDLLNYENVTAYSSNSISGRSGSTTIHLAQCQSSYKKTAAYIEVLIETQFGVTINGNSDTTEVPVANSDSVAPKFTLTHYTACTGPSWCSLDEELSREAVTLRWGAGTPGTNNPIDHYEVWRAEMASPDAAYPEDWGLVGSTGKTSMNVDPPDTVGHYYLFSVWLPHCAAHSEKSRAHSWVLSFSRPLPKP